MVAYRTVAATNIIQQMGYGSSGSSGTTAGTINHSGFFSPTMPMAVLETSVFTPIWIGETVPEAPSAPATTGDVVMRAVGHASTTGVKAAAAGTTLRAGARVAITGGKAVSGTTTIRGEARGATTGSKGSVGAPNERGIGRLSITMLKGSLGSAILRATGALTSTGLIGSGGPGTTGAAVLRGLGFMRATGVRSPRGMTSLRRTVRPLASVRRDVLRLAPPLRVGTPRTVKQMTEAIPRTQRP